MIFKNHIFLKGERQYTITIMDFGPSTFDLRRKKTDMRLIYENM
jgi:hypothetical protein